MMRHVCIPVIVLCVSWSYSAQAQTIYDLNATFASHMLSPDFRSSSFGPFAVGYSEANGVGNAPSRFSAFFPEQSLVGILGANDVRGFVGSAGNLVPVVAVNTSTEEATLDNLLTLAPGEILWHPGGLNFNPEFEIRDAMIRFTAPSSGDYAIIGNASDLDIGTTEFFISQNGTSLFEGRAIDFSGTFALNVTLNAGEAVDLALDSRGLIGQDSNGLRDVRFVFSSQDDPFLPDIVNQLPGRPSTDITSVTGVNPPDVEFQPEQWEFLDLPSGVWSDPPHTEGFLYETTDGSLFVEVLDFPNGFDDTFDVYAEETLLGSFGPGESVDFVAELGHGVSRFAILGIEPTVDAGDLRGFPLRLKFDTATASFTMQGLTSAVAVPEPTNIYIWFVVVLVVYASTRFKFARRALPDAIQN